jgi:hypothetical protein
VPRFERSALSVLHRRAPLIVQQALYWDEAVPGLPCEVIKPAFDHERGLASGARRLPYVAGLVFKVLGIETTPGRVVIRAFCSRVRQQVAGVRVPDNFLWA